MDKNQITVLVLFDLSKAFEYVDHKVILISLHELGFSLEVISWFFSYLSNRLQSILNERGTPIELLKTSSGVPQGSVLGPILFLIVINSVARWINFCKYGLIADDMYIYHHCLVYQLQDAVQRVTADSQAIADWARSHSLMINLTKTTAMILGSNGKLKQLQFVEVRPILVDNTVIPYVNSAKCLGLVINQNLSWNSHILQTTRKVNYALHSLKVRKNIYSTEIRRLLVIATILPLIDYCSIVLIDSTSENDLKLQRAVNSSIRFIFNLKKDEHISPHRKELEWLTINYRRLYYAVCFL